MSSNPHILKNIKWKVGECFDPKCWCSPIIPETVIIDEDGNEWDVVVGSAQITKELAQHIVDLHNENLEQRTKSS
jgi:hypothetical protein